MHDRSGEYKRETGQRPESDACDAALAVMRGIDLVRDLVDDDSLFR
jgi:hypothetical protein